MTRPVALPFAAPAMMTGEAAAAYAGMSVNSLRRYGPPPVEIAPDFVRWRRSDLDAWIASLPTKGESAEEDERRAAEEAFG